MRAPRSGAVVTCRFCRSAAGTVVLDLGRQPSCELFPPAGSDPATDPLLPLRLWSCARCGLAQLADDVVPPEEPQGTEPEALRRQAADAVALLVAAGLLDRGRTVREFPSPHGGSWLPLLAAHGAVRAAPGERADVVVDCCFGLMHEPDQRSALRERAAALADGGALVVQFHTLAAITGRGEWNAVRHGHYAYFSVPALRRLLAEVGLVAESAIRFPLYGGTVALVARRGAAPDASVTELDAAETASGVLDPAVLSRLGAAVDTGSIRLARWLAAERAAGRTVHGYGAASRAVALLCRAGVDRGLLPAVADAAPAKQGTRMPGTDIPVVAPAELLAARPHSVLLFVPDLLDEVRATVPVESAGGRWVVEYEWEDVA
ncbi:MAG: class I SAM-dependent methyltransferase [Pseudonocardia sp.]